VRSPLVAALLVLSCSSELELPKPSEASPPSVSFEPESPSGIAPSVFRLRVREAARRSALADFRMFSGELGSYHVGRIRARELPATLVEREIPLLTWVTKDDVVVAPLLALPSGKVSLATPELGLVAEVVVDAGALPLLARIWPPPDVVFANGDAIYCGHAASEVDPAPIVFAPGGEPGSIARGLDETSSFSEECVRVELDAPTLAGVPLLPPPVAGNVLLEPRLLVAAAPAPLEAACTDSELGFGPLCALVDDDRLTLRAPEKPAFVAFESPGTLLGAVQPGKSLVLRGFEPASLGRVTGLVIAISGERTRIDMEVVTKPARPHVVLNEVLANPAGAETAGEWIELVNDGAESVELEGFVLDDAVERTPLPAVTLAPGELALLVAEAYAPDPELDVVPRPEVTRLRLPRLGRGGLANSGELLRLRDPFGNVVSRLPALAAKGPGTSVARRNPDAPDEPAWFGAHAAPGASPGEANQLEEP
jgi:hypothetical protein